MYFTYDFIFYRDFVSVRLWDKKDDCYASAALSVEHPHAPKQKHHVR